MTGMSGLSSASTVTRYTEGRFSVTKVKFSNGHTMTARKTKNDSPKKLRPKYNYKLLSAAILRAKTPDAAALAVMKARKKLGELLISSGDNADPDLNAAIAHAKKMVLIAGRKKKHLEQEEEAERGKSVFGEDEKSEEMLEGSPESGKSEKEAMKALEEEEKQIAEELERMEREMTEEMLKELSELSDELMKNQEKMLEEEMPEFAGSPDVSDMSADDVKELKRKHRSDELRDITKADMDFLKAKFYRLQQEKAVAGVKGFSSGGESGGVTNVSDVPMDICVDASMDMEVPVSDMGAIVDATV